MYVYLEDDGGDQFVYIGTLGAYIIGVGQNWDASRGGFGEYDVEFMRFVDRLWY